MTPPPNIKTKQKQNKTNNQNTQMVNLRNLEDTIKCYFDLLYSIPEFNSKYFFLYYKSNRHPKVLKLLGQIGIIRIKIFDKRAST